MARVFPEKLSESTKSNAERRLYELLSKSLNDEFSVYHSIAWLSREDGRGAFDGEADFLIAHPKLGILVLEVKGGRIELDGVGGSWYSIDRYDARHKIKNPILQAQNSRYSLYRKLRDNRLTNNYRFPVYHAVVFPDVIVKNDINLALPKEIIIDQEDLGKIANRILEIFDYWDPENEKGENPGESGIAALSQLLAPSFILESYLYATFKDEEEKIKELTEQQFSTLNLLTRERRAIIFGCAGSGKTLIALEKARRLSNEGHSVLFTCFNTRLADWLNSTPYGNMGVKIASFHKLCVELSKSAGIRIPDLNSEIIQGNEAYFFGTLLPECLMDAAGQLGPQYTAIIVDEGQDFHGNWWIPLEALLSEPDSDIMYVFSDDNQNIYAGRDQEYPFLSPAITLDKNCRNTQSIHQLVEKFYVGAVRPSAIGPVGRKPMIYSTVEEGEKSILRRTIHELINSEKIPREDIVILSPRGKDSSQFSEGMHLGNYRISWTDAFSNALFISSIHSFKGLESPVVIVVEIDKLTEVDHQKLLYIALSRARNHLIVIGDLSEPISSVSN